MMSGLKVPLQLAGRYAACGRDFGNVKVAALDQGHPICDMI
jgi:hypothetical protein